MHIYIYIYIEREREGERDREYEYTVWKRYVFAKVLHMHFLYKQARNKKKTKKLLKGNLAKMNIHPKNYVN